MLSPIDFEYPCDIISHMRNTVLLGTYQLVEMGLAMRVFKRNAVVKQQARYVVIVYNAILSDRKTFGIKCQ